MQAADRAIFERRENMGASDIAIEYSRLIMEEMRKGWASPVSTAALIDAAIRKCGTPELFTACQLVAALDDEPESGIALDAMAREQIDGAIAKAKGGAR